MKTCIHCDHHPCYLISLSLGLMKDSAQDDDVTPVVYMQGLHHYWWCCCHACAGHTLFAISCGHN